jgi:hypothetical protein
MFHVREPTKGDKKTTRLEQRDYMKGRISMVQQLKRGLVGLMTAAMIMSNMTPTVFAATTVDNGTWSSDHKTYTYWATVDGKSAKQEAKGDDIVSKEIKAATCKDDGTTTYTATLVDGSTVTDTVTISHETVDHTWNDTWEKVITKKPTCTEKGEYKYQKVCDVCGDKADVEGETGEIAATGHDYKVKSEKVLTEATCAEEGSAGSKQVVKRCSSCDDEISVTEEIKAPDHKLTTISEDPATCTTNGAKKEKCENCNEVFTTILPATRHTYEWKTITGDTRYPVVEATCEEEGSHYEQQICKTCGAKGEISEKITDEAKGHTWVADEDDKNAEAPTCTTTGKAISTCSVCGTHAAAATLPMIPHTYDGTTKDVNVVEATCQQDGSHDVAEYCTVCGYENILKANVIDKKVDHAAAKPVEETIEEKTCNKAGSYNLVTYCKWCNEKLTSETVEVPAGHTWSENYTEDTASTVEPTCTKDGYHYMVRTCTVCGKVNAADKVEANKVTDPALGHYWDFDDSKTIQDSTCTEEGIGSGVCLRENCGATTTVIPALGHQYNEEDVLYASDADRPTCTKEGTGKVKCGKCEKVVTVTTDKIAHTAGDAKVVTAVTDCTKGGTKVTAQYCKVCGTEIEGSRVETKVDATEAHVYDSGEIIWNRDYTGGTAYFSCTSDGCQEVLKVESDAKSLTTNATVPASCTETGTKSVTLTISKKVGDVTLTATDIKDVEIPKVAHKLLDPVQETIDGTKYTVVRCATCNEIQAKEVVGQHTSEVEIEGKEATCTEDGLTAGKQCTLCGEWTVKQEVIPAAHTPEKVEKVEATCTKDGQEAGTKCSVCGKWLVEKDGEYVEADEAPATIPATGKHTESKVVLENEVKATYDKAGSYDKVVYCTVCNEELSRETVAIAKLTKAAQTISVKPTSKTVKASKVKKAAQKFTVKATAKGNVTFKKSSGSKKVTITKAGKVTVKKGTKKGTYKIKVKVSAAATSKYAATSKTVTITVKVK